MKSIGSSAVIGGFGSLVASSTAAGYIPADPEGNIPDDDWETYAEWVVDQHYDGASSSSKDFDKDRLPIGGGISMPNPQSFSFDVCGHNEDGDELCIKSFDEGTESYHACAGKTLVTFSYTVSKYEISWGGDLTLKWTITIWMGFDENDCVWFGTTNQNGTEVCSQMDCQNSFDQTSLVDKKEDSADIGMEAVDRIRDHNGGNPAPESFAAIAGAAGLGAARYLAAPFDSASSSEEE